MKGVVAALTCAAAVLTGATAAQAVEQFPKNGCESPQAYTGSITSPPVTVPNPIEGPAPELRFQGWFEIESVSPGSFDTMTAQYSLDPATTGGTRVWVPFGSLTDSDQGVPPNGEDGSGNPVPTGAEFPYSNNGTSVTPSFQSFVFQIPGAAFGQNNVQFRIEFDTGDSTYQGFRGLGVDNVAIDNLSNLAPQSFESGSLAPWTRDPATSPAGDPFWQVLTNPQNSVSIKSPEINPDLVTLPDAGALPPPPPGAAANTRYAWFGNTASGTFCGPDFALRGDLTFPDTTITSGPPTSTASNDATFTFTSSEPAIGFECSIDGGAFTGCPSPQTYAGLTEGGHTFAVRAIDFSGNRDSTPATYSWNIRPATLADLDNPTLGVDVNVQEVAGTVLVGIPRRGARASRNGQASQKGVTFVPLNEARQIPVGSFLDTRKGTVRLESAANARGKRQRGTFLQGLFQVRQSKKRSAKGLTDLILKGSNFRRCQARGSGDASAAGLSRRSIRRLRANARGRYRTSGRNSSATVRGTKWGVTDRCDGTLTKVQRGSVVVRDFRRKKNIVVRAGKSYLAKARR